MEITIENSLLIAKFDGIKPIKGFNEHTGKEYYYYNNAEMQDYEALPDYTDWNELMPVVDKIESLGYNFNIDSRQDKLWNEIKVDSHITISSQKAKSLEEWSNLGMDNLHDLFLIEYFNLPSEKLEATYKVVIQFIEWYNVHKKSQ